MNQVWNVFTGDIVWPDGTTSIFPPIVKERSGWWYKPLAAIKHDGKKCFGMGSTGYDEAKEWHTALLKEAWRKHPEHPVKLGSPVLRTDLDGSGTSVAYQHPIYGQVTLSLTVGTNHSYYSRKPAVTYQIEYHQMLNRHSGHTYDPWSSTVDKRYTKKEAEPQQIEGLIKAWQRDPWGTTAAKVDLPTGVLGGLDPPQELLAARENPIPFDEEEQEFGKLRTYADRSLRRHLGAEVKKMVNESMGALEELGKALKYFGVTFNVRTSWRGNDKIITGVSVDVPAGTNQNEEGHTFNITEDGISVTCGYVTAERRYQHYEKEKARKLLQELDKDEFVVHEFERNE